MKSLINYIEIIIIMLNILKDFDIFNRNSYRNITKFDYNYLFIILKEKNLLLNFIGLKKIITHLKSFHDDC